MFRSNITQQGSRADKIPSIEPFCFTHVSDWLGTAQLHEGSQSVLFSPLTQRDGIRKGPERHTIKRLGALWLNQAVT